MERLQGTVFKLRKKEGWGLIKAEGRPNHRFVVTGDLEDIQLFSMVWFTSYPKQPGQNYYNAGNLAIIRNPEKAA